MVMNNPENPNGYDTGKSSSSQALEKDFYPDPRTLPSPPALREPLPSVTLSELEPGKYISTAARIVYLLARKSFLVA